MVTVPPESLRQDMMDPIQLMLSDEPPNSSCSATKKIPKLFNVPITNTFTWKNTSRFNWFQLNTSILSRQRSSKSESLTVGFMTYQETMQNHHPTPTAIWWIHINNLLLFFLHGLGILFRAGDFGSLAITETSQHPFNINQWEIHFHKMITSSPSETYNPLQMKGFQKHNN